MLVFISFWVKHLKPEGKQTIYVGQADVRNSREGIYRRLLEHKKDKNEWNEVIVLTSKDGSLGATEICYLENNFTKKAFEASRYQVINKNIPTQGSLSKEKQAEMDEFIDQSLVIIGVLGNKAFQPLINNAEQNSIIFNFAGTYNAHLTLTNEDYVLLKDSQISDKLSKSARDATRKDRIKYKEKISSDFTTLDDLLFSSPSGAGSFVTGSPISGNACWKTKDNKSPKDI